MEICKSCVDDAVQAAMKVLKTSGYYFNSHEIDALNNSVRAFLQDDCGLVVATEEGPTKT